MRNLLGLFCCVATVALLAVALGVTHDVDALWGTLGIALVAGWFPWDRHAHAPRAAALFFGISGILGLIAYALVLTGNLDALWALLAIPVFVARFRSFNAIPARAKTTS